MPISVLGNSYNTAHKSLQRTLKKLKKDEEYQSLYFKFMSEYEQLNHMEKVSSHPSTGAVHYYLPHHGVLKPDSVTTKLRVVFNGSNVLMWIRGHQYIFTTDITKMYRQIRVHPEDWNLRRILWIDENLNESQDVFTFSVISASHYDRLTKRLILSEVVQIFDPLGFVSPVVIRAKMLLQELWLCKLNWYDSLPFQVTSRWLNIRKDLTSLARLSIPRCHLPGSRYTVHGCHGLTHLLKNEGSTTQETHNPEVRAHSSAATCKTNETCLSHTQNGHQRYIHVDGFSSNSYVDQDTHPAGKITYATEFLKYKNSRQVLIGEPAAALTPASMEWSRLFWIKATQSAFFAHELTILNSQSPLPASYAFNRLTAFIDHQGVICVGGRLNNSSLTFDGKHPVILSRHARLSELIIDASHKQTLHRGTQLTLAHLRQSYWIIGGRAPVKSHILRCVVCARQREIRAHQLMGQLPLARVTPSCAFIHTGIDYAGPLTFKTWKGRGAKTHKGWICLFHDVRSSSRGRLRLLNGRIHLNLQEVHITEGYSTHTVL
ncbi:hypothetical protein DMN91_011841 [Ooceraea biroi]|uniref:Integrase zinc-binding domain-containing protein n=1 Tax=Ooceraea biroi TaxID=2015173 RepID=A0A3L8D7L0_OOCBI|nr:hypothetical protein DMN91_011841 [Ooceraea biroi]